VTWQNRVADSMTAFSGSMTFVYLHVIWFGAWLLCNEGVFGKSLIFDPFPFGLLTLIVSLEAIFLSTFVLISQNRQQERADRRSQADYENDIRAETWSIHLGRKLGRRPGLRRGRRPAEAAQYPEVRRQLTGLRRGVVSLGEQPTGRGFIAGGNQHANTLQLQLWLLGLQSGPLAALNSRARLAAGSC
jgi:uncharacterized membrane protein